jgi:hypothetical protein
MDEDMDHEEEEDDLTETLDHVVIIPMAEEMKSFYEIVPCMLMKEF